MDQVSYNLGAGAAESARLASETRFIKDAIEKIDGWQKYAKKLEQEILDLKDDLATKDVELKDAKYQLLLAQLKQAASQKTVQAYKGEAISCPEKTSHHILLQQKTNESGKPLIHSNGNAFTNGQGVWADTYNEKASELGLPPCEMPIVDPKA